MAVERQRDDLAGLLSELKQRSGLSYAELARRTYTSSSALHRYCTGRGNPPDYQLVAKIGQACGASGEELNDLLRRWRCSTGKSPQPSRPTKDPPAVRASRPQAGRRHRRLTVGALAALVVLTFLLVHSSAPDTTGVASTEPIAALSWVTDPDPVPSALFGVTMNSTTGAMPSFRVGSVRLWDSHTRWANLQPQRDRFDWATLDRLVDGARHAGLPALFVLGGTPQWAAPNSPKGAYPDGSRTAPPDDLADWDRFVRALVERYRGRLDAYELWAYATDPRFYSGSVDTLAEMTRRAATIVRSADPDAVIVCPSMGHLWQAKGRDILRRFAELGGYEHCDAAGVKLHQRHAADPPETLVRLLTEIDSTMHAAGVHPALWNTGTTYDIPLQGSLDRRRSVDYAMRFYLAGLYGREFGLARMYFYNWGSGRLPLVLQAEGTPPTGAGLAVETLQRWLVGTRLQSCGQGLPAGLPGNAWQCEFIDEADRRLIVRWTHTGTADTAAGPGVESLTGIDGTTTALRPGDSIRVTETPLLITHRADDAVPRSGRNGW
ncbi:transcriptional regulator with XRE-family HTH domain [Streptosporangium album]|uniref:Transcriptional regulator with XRE-family HTH domain n=1 Tax=Streptosporangium album TaxID=47479 RepID=A0A7W7S3V3_9ACTN|nr:helix-turn-helix domain-containing protein [Streptosporangium album]MBB4943420.1 transcriptional regulator with XRE-family HTH domain [Streptosporangium album]